MLPRMIVLADIVPSSGDLAFGALPFLALAVGAIVAVRFLLPPKR